MSRWVLVIAALLGAWLLRPAPSPVAAQGPAGVSMVATALGGFNGLAAGYLWLYATNQRAAGRPFDQLRLARWISALQPRLGSLHDFQATILAYDVADSLGDPAAGWPWVRAGIDLLWTEASGPRHDDPRAATALAALLLGRVCGGSSGAGTYYQQAYSSLWLDGTPAVWPLEPAVVAALEAEVGALDWRAGQSAALYWAWRAAQLEPDPRLRRQAWAFAISALRSAAYDGQIVVSKGEPVFITGPQAHLLAGLERIYDRALADVPDDPGLRLNREGWADEALPLAVAAGLSPDRGGAIATLLAEDLQAPELLARMAVDRELRSLLCRALGADEPARVLHGVARIAAEAGEAEWPEIVVEARETLKAQGLSAAAEGRALATSW